MIEGGKVSQPSAAKLIALLNQTLIDMQKKCPSIKFAREACPPTLYYPNGCPVLGEGPQKDDL